jgi:hypothetical protein
VKSRDKRVGKRQLAVPLSYISGFGEAVIQHFLEIEAVCKINLEVEDET